MHAFFDALSDDGILVMQLGEAPPFDSPDETNTRFRNRPATTRLLEDTGFQSIHAYEEVSRNQILRAVMHKRNVAYRDSLTLGPFIRHQRRDIAGSMPHGCILLDSSHPRLARDGRGMSHKSMSMSIVVPSGPSQVRVRFTTLTDQPWCLIKFRTRP